MKLGIMGSDTVGRTLAGKLAAMGHQVMVGTRDPVALLARTETPRRGGKQVIDLGDITNARATEMYLPLWVRLYGTLGNPIFNIRILK